MNTKRIISESRDGSITSRQGWAGNGPVQSSWREKFRLFKRLVMPMVATLLALSMSSAHATGLVIDEQSDVAAGGSAAGTLHGTWTWSTQYPTAYSGTHSRRLINLSGAQAHSVRDLNYTVQYGDSLSTWVYMKSSDVPSTLQLKVQIDDQTWVRAHWGTYSSTTYPSKNNGSVPSTRWQWVQLTADLDDFNNTILVGDRITGIQLAVQNGKAWFDRTLVGRTHSNDKLTFVAAKQKDDWNSNPSVAGALKAIDGNPDGNWTGVASTNSVTHTSSSSNTWWQGDLGSTKNIKKVTLYNRSGCCESRLKEYYILASDVDLAGMTLAEARAAANGERYATQQVTSNGYTFTMPSNTRGRYVMIYKEANNILSLAEVIVTGSESSDIINFNDYTLSSYADNQDEPLTGPLVKGDFGLSLRVRGNRWLSMPYDYTVTADTVLEFEFESTVTGDIQGIGFDNDNTHSSGTTFKLNGTQSWAHENYFYGGSRIGLKKYKIPVGHYFTGTFDRMVFVNDHDGSQSVFADSKFKNVRVYEGIGQGAVHRLEAEEIPLADRSSNHIIQDRTYYSNGQGLDFDGEGYLDWQVVTENAGMYLLKFGYGLSSTSSNTSRDMTLSVDNTSLDTIAFEPAANNWSTIGEAEYRVFLTAGDHTITLTSNGSSGPNFDYMDFVELTEEITGLGGGASTRNPSNTAQTLYYGGSGTTPFGQERFVGSSAFTPKMLFFSDKIVHPNDDALYAELTGDGDFVVMDNGTEVFNSKTSAASLATTELQESVHHALCQSEASTGNNPVCTRGVAVQLDYQGLRVVDNAGMIVWRPDLGDLDLVDTSEGFYLRLAKRTANNGVLELVTVAGTNQKVLWDSVNGYRPVIKEVQGLFTAIEKDENAQRPQAPYDMFDHGLVTVSSQHSNGERHTYIPEQIKQQSVLHNTESIIYTDGTTAVTRSRDKLVDDVDSPTLSVQLTTNTLRNSLRLYRNPNTSPSLLWESTATIQSEATSTSLHVTHRGIEIVSYTGYGTDDNSSDKTVVWSVYPDGTGVDNNYMLTINEELDRVELHNMTTNRLRWYADENSGGNGVTVSATSSAHRHNIAHVLHKRMSGAWSHLTHFVQGVASSAANTVPDTAEWTHFKDLFNDATHLKVHAALHDIAKLNADVDSDIATALSDVEEVMEIIGELALNTFYDTLPGSGVGKELFDVLSHPKRIADYVHHIAESMKDASNKRKLFTKLLSDPQAVEDAVATYLDNELDEVSASLEETLMTSLQAHRRLKSDGLNAKALVDGWTSTNCSPICQMLTKHEGVFFEIDLEGLLNILTAGTGERIGATHSLNHLQFRVGARPFARLVDVDGDGVLDQSRLQLAVKILDIASLLKLGGKSFVSAGIFTSHDWLVYLRNFEPDGTKLPTSSTLATYSSTVGGLVWGDLNMETLFGEAEKATQTANASADINSASHSLGTLESVSNDVAGQGLELTGLSSAGTALSGEMPNAMAAGVQAGAENAASSVISAGDSLVEINVDTLEYTVGNAPAAAVLGQAAVVGATTEEALVGGAAEAAGNSAGLVELLGDMFHMVNQVGKLTQVTGQQSVTLTEVLGGGNYTYAYKYSEMTAGQIALLHLTEATGAVGVPWIINLATDGAATASLAKIVDNPVTALNLETMMGSFIADTALFFIGREANTSFKDRSSLKAGAFAYIALTGTFNAQVGIFELSPDARRGDTPAWTNKGFRKLPRIRFHAQTNASSTLAD